MFTPSSLKNVLVKGAISSPKISLSSLKLANYYSTILKTMELKISRIKDNEVLIKFLAASINPFDINQIKDDFNVYPIKPRFRGYGAIGGNEGVAEVVAAGSKIKNMTIGDWVIPDTKAFAKFLMGTWQTFAARTENELQKISKYGDIVIKNGKNSAVGQLGGIKTIDVIRDWFTYFNKVIGELYKLGATLVIKEEDLHTNFSRELVESLGSPVRLALNCVSGKSTSGITPTIFSTSPFIFINFQACEASKRGKQYIFDDICEFVRGGHLAEPWHEGTKCERIDDNKTFNKKFMTVLGKEGTRFGNKKQNLTFNLNKFNKKFKLKINNKLNLSFDITTKFNSGFDILVLGFSADLFIKTFISRLSNKPDSMKEYELVETLVEFYKGKGNTIGRVSRTHEAVIIVLTLLTEDFVTLPESNGLIMVLIVEESLLTRVNLKIFWLNNEEIEVFDSRKADNLSSHRPFDIEIEIKLIPEDQLYLWPMHSLMYAEIEESRSFIHRSNSLLESHKQDGFHRLCVDYRRFNFPLLKRNIKFIWTKEADDTFKKLENSFFEIDKSDFGLRCILSQVSDDDNLLHPLAFYSRYLKNSEFSSLFWISLCFDIETHIETLLTIQYLQYFNITVPLLNMTGVFPSFLGDGYNNSKHSSDNYFTVMKQHFEEAKNDFKKFWGNKCINDSEFKECDFVLLQ
ncbi:hypothetical protein U3516DRAFT_872911 [Neocallimastix sp. 'constans']